jgi:phage FluMu protein Com
MADIHFFCPHCEKSLVVEEEGAGLEVPCPHCGELLTIPGPETDGSRPETEETDMQPSPAPAVARPEPAAASTVTSSLASSLHRQQANEDERHSQDVNVDQPFYKKKDQWFSGKHKKYHYCYYDPHAPQMRTACGTEVIPVSADVAPTPLSKLRKGAFCRQCLDALGTTLDEIR